MEFHDCKTPEERMTYLEGAKSGVNAVRKNFEEYFAVEGNTSMLSKSYSDSVINDILADISAAKDHIRYTASKEPPAKKSPVDILDEFTKSWCMNKEETLARDDLCFRCGMCEFSTDDGHCLVKKFAKDKGPKRKVFGAMS